LIVIESDFVSAGEEAPVLPLTCGKSILFEMQIENKSTIEK